MADKLIDKYRNASFWDTKADMQKVAKYYGFKNQADKAVEELGELIEALNGYKDGTDTLTHLCEEIADVHVMVSQIEYLLDISPYAINEIMHTKLERQLKRIEDARVGRNE